MKHRAKKTKFESFSQRFLIISMVIFAFGITYVRSLESSYNKKKKKTESEIKEIQDEIDYLELKKQEMASFSRLSNVASKKWYIYNNESGFLGISGISSDFRVIEKMYNQNDEYAIRTINLYSRMIAKYIGSYFVELGGCDVIAFMAVIV